jgi:DNA-directed RNA polymerase alpha subunit
MAARTPRLSVLEERGNRATFAVTPTDETFMLCLLHAVLDDTPGVAFHLVEFEENGSEACDEWIALRLGLLPLQETPPSRLSSHASCECEGPFCADCGVIAFLDVRNPPDGPVGLPVTSDDIIMTGAGVSVVTTASPATIAFLQPGRRLCLGLVACKGTGSEHAKYGVAVAPRYVRSESQDDTFLLYLETTGAVTPRTLLRAALESVGRQAEILRALHEEASAALAARP